MLILLIVASMWLSTEPASSSASPAAESLRPPWYQRLWGAPPAAAKVRLVVEELDDNNERHHPSDGAPAVVNVTAAVVRPPPPLLQSTSASTPGQPSTSSVAGIFTNLRLKFLNHSVSLNDLVGMSPANPAALCELFLLGNPKCQGMLSGDETMEECVVRYGTAAWTAALQPQCTRSPFWRSFVNAIDANNTLGSGGGVGGAPVDPRELFDPVMQAHVLHRARPRCRRTPTPFHPPLRCSYGNVYPTGFCLPDSELNWWWGANQTLVISDSRPKAHLKLWDWYPVLPSFVPYHETRKIQKKLGPRPRFVSGAEDEYLHTLMYRFSRFAWTHARMGADCQRHYDIIGGGALPVFPDLRTLPHVLVSHLPRHLLLDATFQLPGIRGVVFEIGDQGGRVNTELYFRTWAKQMNFKKLGTVNHTDFDEEAYTALQHSLLAYARENLTCGSVVEHALQVMNATSVATAAPPPPNNGTSSHTARVLFMGHPTIDYMTVAVERGLYELGIEYAVTLPLGEHHQQIDEAVDDIRSGEAYDLWRQKMRLNDVYGRNFHVGRRIPPPPAHLQVHPSELCPENGTSILDHIDVVLVSHPLLRASTLHCEHILASRVAQGTLKVAVFDGGDAASTALYPTFVRQGFYVFSREASCGHP